MPRITISYRRDDSLDITGRIFDRLAAYFGRESVFRDIDNIPPGADFRRHIDVLLEQSDIVLAIVGPRWIGPRAGQSRLVNPADPVRLEIETALRKNKPLIPVLVSRAPMPRPEQLPETLHDFAYRNAVQLDAGQDFDIHIGRLIRSIDRILGVDTEQRAGEAAAGVVVAPDMDNTDAVLDQDVPPEPEVKLTAEIEALRSANRALEAQLATIASERAEEGQRAAGLQREIADARDAATSSGQNATAAEGQLALRERRIADLTTVIEALREAKQTLEGDVQKLATARQAEAETVMQLREELAATSLRKDEKIQKLTSELDALATHVHAQTGYMKSGSQPVYEGKWWEEILYTKNANILIESLPIVSIRVAVAIIFALMLSPALLMGEITNLFSTSLWFMFFVSIDSSIVIFSLRNIYTTILVKQYHVLMIIILLFSILTIVIISYEDYHLGIKIFSVNIILISIMFLIPAIVCWNLQRDVPPATIGMLVGILLGLEGLLEGAARQDWGSYLSVFFAGYCSVYGIHLGIRYLHTVNQHATR